MRWRRRGGGRRRRRRGGFRRLRRFLWSGRLRDGPIERQRRWNVGRRRSGSTLIVMVDAGRVRDGCHGHARRRGDRRGARVALRPDPRQMLHAAGAGREDHRQRQRHRPARRSRFVRDGNPKNAAHAIEQRPAGRRHRHPRREGAPGFELGERLCVADRVAAERDGDVVAAVLALHANPLRQPPHGRVVEQERLRDRLQHVQGVVVAADVRELVRQDRFDLRRRQRRECGDREQNRRTQPADDGRDVHQRRLDDVRGRGQTEPVRQTAAGRLPAGRGAAERGAMQPAHVPPPACHPAEQKSDADEPRDRDARQDTIDRSAKALRHSSTVVEVGECGATL